RVWTSIYQAVDRGISTLRHNADSIIASINNLVGYMEKKGSSPTTISGHKFKLIKLYRWLKLPVGDEDLKEAVRKVDSVNVTDDRHLTREQVRDIQAPQQRQTEGSRQLHGMHRGKNRRGRPSPGTRYRLH